VDTLGRWTIFVVLAIGWIAFSVWVWRWRGFDSFAAEYRGWGIVVRIAFILFTAILILRGCP
jgi:hypothetical protein